MKDQSDTVPCKRYFARAVRLPSGFHAGEYGIPGLFPDYVRQRGEVCEFEGEIAAYRAAKMCIADTLIARLSDTSKPERYRFASGAEFAACLQEAGITPTSFARIFGTTQANVLAWIDGARDIPHAARVLVELFRRHPDCVAMAEAVTARVTEPR